MTCREGERECVCLTCSAVFLEGVVCVINDKDTGVGFVLSGELRGMAMEANAHPPLPQLIKYSEDLIEKLLSFCLK